MKTLFNKLVGAVFGALAFATTTGVAMAQTYDYSYRSSDDAAAAMGAGFGMIGLVFMCVGGLLGLVSFAFWVWMLVDLFKRDFKDKTLWLVLMFGSWLFGLPLIVSILYYFLVKKKYDKK